MITGTNSDFTRAYNRRVVLSCVRERGSASRTEVARQTGLSLQAISTIVSELQAEGWITSRGRRATSRGQPPIDYELDPDNCRSVGVVIDVGGISGLVGDISGSILAERHYDLRRFSPSQAVDVIVPMVEELLEEVRGRGTRVVGVGVAVPGISDPETNTVTLQNLAGWEQFPLRDAIADHFELPVYVANDAIVTALGESWFGESRHSKDFFYVFFAHGLNGALISDRQPYGGLWGITGNVGHIPVEPNGRHCPTCGGQGCLEQYASRLSLERAVGIEQPSEELLVSLLAQGDETLAAWLEEAASHLITALVSVENLFDPERIVFGGRIPRPILEALLDKIEVPLGGRRMKRIKQRQPSLLISDISEKAVAVGAFSLPLHQAVFPSMELALQDVGRGEATRA